VTIIQSNIRPRRTETAKQTELYCCAV